GGVPRSGPSVERTDGREHDRVVVRPPTGGTDRTPVPGEVALVTDTSGSMHGVSIGQAKQARLLALGDLRPEDRFNVIQFNPYAEALFDTSVAATPENVARARAWVARLTANGGTEVRAARERALAAAAPQPHLKQVVH